ncbi:hypothetical protein DFQ28_005033 [Apophysomyces sp. BC1034]|nr:hypothetical protein DFQ29_000474 [Apophysomyces sp. BC1021]KAG0194820.1 hypothetical protein DFQ28_005033 [Apophysomyces sp. BC1034]
MYLSYFCTKVLGGAILIDHGRCLMLNLCRNLCENALVGLLFEISRFLPLFLMMIPSTQMCKLIIGTKTLNVLATSPIRLDIDDVPMIGASSVNGFQPSKATQIYLDQQLLETISRWVKDHANKTPSNNHSCLGKTLLGHRHSKQPWIQI